MGREQLAKGESEKEGTKLLSQMDEVRVDDGDDDVDCESCF